MPERRSSLEAKEEEATLSIVRNDPRDCTYRIIRVLVDEEPQDSLNFGETLEVKVRPGLHTVTVDNTWVSKSLTVACRPRSKLSLVTANIANGCALTLLFTLGISPIGLILEEHYD